jgi:hypothetical protein
MLSPRDFLRPDNHDLYDEIAAEMNAQPPVSLTSIADRLGVSVDELCRFVLEHRNPPKSAYQSPRFPALRPPRHAGVDTFVLPAETQSRRNAQRARDGARATRQALELEGHSR